MRNTFRGVVRKSLEQWCVVRKDFKGFLVSFGCVFYGHQLEKRPRPGNGWWPAIGVVETRGRSNGPVK